jgi:hypothetical protein
MKVLTTNPRFLFGGSTPEISDCLGLVIQNLRDLGYQCPWETSVPRRFCRYAELLEMALDNGFTETSLEQISVEKIENNGVIVRAGAVGHICLLDPETLNLYHVGASGLTILPPTSYQQIVYFRYEGL